MKVTIGGVIVADGTEDECAKYSFILLEMLRLNNERMKKEEESEWFAKYGDMTFADILKMERDEEQ